MLVAHSADVVYAAPAAIGLVVVALLTWRSSRRARRAGPAEMRDDPHDQPSARSISSANTGAL